ncbi:hypothetical protein, partial [Burkholderia pseudomallei]
MIFYDAKFFSYREISGANKNRRECAGFRGRGGYARVANAAAGRRLCRGIAAARAVALAVAAPRAVGFTVAATRLAAPAAGAAAAMAAARL